MFLCKEFISRGTKRCLGISTYTEFHKTRLPKTCYQKSVQMNLSQTAKHDRNTIHTHVKIYLIILGDFRITHFINYLRRHAVAQLVEELRCKPEGFGFGSRCCHWNFSLT
jgi:hypothetical protein